MEDLNRALQALEGEHAQLKDINNKVIDEVEAEMSLRK